MLSFWKSGIMTIFRDFLVLYCKMLRVSMGYKSSLSVLSWRWLLVVDCSKIWTFAGTVNLLTFPEVICRGALPLLELLPLLRIAEVEGLGFCAWGLAFTDWDLCCGHGDGLMFLEFSLLRRVAFDLTSYKRRVFFFAASILKYLFFLYSHRLSHDVWAPLNSGHFYLLSRGALWSFVRAWAGSALCTFLAINWDVTIFIAIKSLLNSAGMIIPHTSMQNMI